MFVFVCACTSTIVPSLSEHVVAPHLTLLPPSLSLSSFHEVRQCLDLGNNLFTCSPPFLALFTLSCLPGVRKLRPLSFSHLCLWETLKQWLPQALQFACCPHSGQWTWIAIALSEWVIQWSTLDTWSYTCAISARCHHYTRPVVSLPDFRLKLCLLQTNMHVF